MTHYDRIRRDLETRYTHEHIVQEELKERVQDGESRTRGVCHYLHGEYKNVRQGIRYGKMWLMIESNDENALQMVEEMIEKETFSRDQEQERKGCTFPVWNDRIKHYESLRDLLLAT